MPDRWQNRISLRTSESETSCGVVTRMLPSIPESRRKFTIEMCSSEVPGGAERKIKGEKHTVDYQVIQLAPINLAEELLDES